MESWNLRQINVPFLAGLNDYTNKTFLSPGVERLARKEGSYRERAALYLASLYGQVDICAGVVTGNDVEFRPDRLFQELGQVVSR